MRSAVYYCNESGERGRIGGDARDKNPVFDCSPYYVKFGVHARERLMGGVPIEKRLPLVRVEGVIVLVQ